MLNILKCPQSRSMKSKHRAWIRLVEWLKPGKGQVIYSYCRRKVAHCLRLSEYVYGSLIGVVHPVIQCLCLKHRKSNRCQSLFNASSPEVVKVEPKIIEIYVLPIFTCEWIRSSVGSNVGANIGLNVGKNVRRESKANITILRKTW